MASDQVSAVTAPTQFVESKGRRLAYRSIGQGEPLLLCVRFRGVLDVWDPAFLDALAQTFRVITFDYSDLGQSTGTADYTPRALAQDGIDLADALGLHTFVLGGWSLGGQGAQVLAVLHPERVRRVVLIGTTPPGKVARGPEPVFYERALKFDNDLADEIVLFFEPASEKSRAAAQATHDRIAQRTEGRSPVIPRRPTGGCWLRMHDPESCSTTRVVTRRSSRPHRFRSSSSQATMRSCFQCRIGSIASQLGARCTSWSFRKPGTRPIIRNLSSSPE